MLKPRRTRGVRRYGQGSRNWDALEAIRGLETLADDETLLVQSGKPVGIVRTHVDAPRVLIAIQFVEAGHMIIFVTGEKGIDDVRQMTADHGIGTQGILQGTYETFAEAGRRHFGSDDLTGRLVVTGGLGGMGGAQPLAATMNNGTFLGFDVDPERVRRRQEHRYLDEIAESIDDGIDRAVRYRAAGVGKSIGVVANAADGLERLIERGIVPDLLTDQTSAHDPLSGYIPRGLSMGEACSLRSSDPNEYVERSRATMADHVRAMLELQSLGSHTFDYGNNLRAEAEEGGVSNAFDFPGFVPAYIRPLFCEGKGPFRWVALSGDPEDIYKTDKVIAELFPEDAALARWLKMARERVHFQGLPSRICWLGYGERAKAGLAFNELVRKGEVSAPIVIGRDHLDCGSVALQIEKRKA